MAGNHSPVLCKGVIIKPNFFPLSGMTMNKDFGLVVSRNLIPISDMLEITSLIGLGALFVVETEERAIFFLRG